MIYLFVSIVVPLAIYILLPSIVECLTKKRPPRNLLLLIACLIYFISWYLPSPLIEGSNTSFTTHLIGGGVFSGLIWLYLKRQLHWNSSWPAELLSLYALVCTLGVTNELFELVIFQLGFRPINGADTWWDLLANTLGMLIFWLFYRVLSQSDD